MEILSLNNFQSNRLNSAQAEYVSVDSNLFRDKS